MPQTEESQSQFEEFLAELNLSRKHIFMAAGCLILLIILIIGGIFGLKWYKNRKTAPAARPPAAKEQEQEQSAKQESQTGISQSGLVGQSAVPLAEIGSTGIFESANIGAEAEAGVLLVQYIADFRRLQNAYAADINELLNKSTDRRSRLRGHVALLKKLHGEGAAALEKINLQLAIIKSQYEQKNKLQQETDVNFFEQLNAYNAATAQNTLEQFIEISREIVSLRARFKPLQKVQGWFEQGLPKIQNRIKDIELNEEALVKGIKVYDVRGSDLQLIVPVEGESAPGTDSLSSTSVPLIPTHPSQVNVGKDFITQPGGGF